MVAVNPSLLAEYAECFRLINDCLRATAPTAVTAAAAQNGQAASGAAPKEREASASKASTPKAHEPAKRPAPPPEAAAEAEPDPKKARVADAEVASPGSAEKTRRSAKAAQLAARLAQLEEKGKELQEMLKKRAEEREQKRLEAEAEAAEEACEEEGEPPEPLPDEDSDVDDGMGINPEQRAILDPSYPFRKVCYFMRGPPGCGKSTAARKLLQYHLKLQGVKWKPGPDAPYSPMCRAFILSTDDFFTYVDEKGNADYRFDPKKLKEFHPKNQSRFENCCELGRTPLFVDNTNIALWEMKDYLLAAEKYGYEVEVVDPREFGEDALNPEVLDQRCQAGAGADRAAGKTIPFQVLDRMCRNLEDLPEPANCPTGAEALDAIRNSSSPFGSKGGGKGGFGGGGGKGGNFQQGGFQRPQFQQGGFQQGGFQMGGFQAPRPKFSPSLHRANSEPLPPPVPEAPPAPVILPKQRMKCKPSAPPPSLQAPEVAPEAAPEASPEAEAAKKADADQPKEPKEPRYAGLDVEAKALALLGTIDLGEWFWSEEHNAALDAIGAPRDVNLFDARCYEPGENEDPWRLPTRLHVTVKFLQGKEGESREPVDALVNTWHNVEVQSLVFVRGGTLLCAEVALNGPESERLRSLAGEGWRPHITLLTAHPYQAKDSTALLEAYSAARSSSPPAEGELVDLDASPPPQGEDDMNAEDRELAASMRNAMSPSANLEKPKMFSNVTLAGGLGTVDLCVIPLNPPCDLGPCRFKLFYK